MDTRLLAMVAAHAKVLMPHLLRPLRHMQERTNARTAMAVTFVIALLLVLSWDKHLARPGAREQLFTSEAARRGDSWDVTTRPGWRESDGSWSVAPRGDGGRMHGFYRKFMDRAKAGGVEQLEWARGRTVVRILRCTIPN